MYLVSCVAIKMYLNLINTVTTEFMFSFFKFIDHTHNGTKIGIHIEKKSNYIVFTIHSVAIKVSTFDIVETSIVDSPHLVNNSLLYCLTVICCTTYTLRKTEL